MSISVNNRDDCRFVRVGFTLVEMLVAMAVTLLMMAALARSFAFVGERIRDSRANVGLSNELRDITTRLNDELGRCTVSLEPNIDAPDQAGYFMYYEGPTTDATSSLFRVTSGSENNLPDSRYGDFDDYIAFTAIAPPGSWFTGKVPRYLLDAKSRELDGATFNPLETEDSRFDPIVIKSRYAEIIYFASPEYGDAPDATAAGYPKYIDLDGDTEADPNDGTTATSENGLPDRIRIHRRVLLIRPDLNVDVNALNTTFSSSDLVNSTSIAEPHLPQLPNGTVTFMAPDTVAANYAVAMAPAHQACDLSLRRVLNANGTSAGVVAANSLEDLTKPHNRFAHVRIPAGTLGAGTGTSMPVLSLTDTATIMHLTNANGDRIAPPLSPASVNVVTPANLSGFLRPEFVLGQDWFHADSGDDAFGRSGRLGEDIFASGVVGFDVQVFDPSAVWVADSSGPLILGPNDAGYRERMNDAAITVAQQAAGGFVDLCYPVLAGGTLRGWATTTVDAQSSSATDSSAVSANVGLLTSEFSGLQGTTTSTLNTYSESLYKSGRLVVDATNQIRLFQPTFDTFTSYYERDGLQHDTRTVTVSGDDFFRGTTWTTSTTGADAGADGLDTDGTFGADDLGERETLPPFLTKPEAVRISIRLESKSTRQIRQSSVTFRGR